MTRSTIPDRRRPYCYDNGSAKEGDDPAPYLAQKNTTKMKQKYNLQCVDRGFLIGPIEDANVRFFMRFLSCKLLNKMRPNQCTGGTIELTELCALGRIFNWLGFHFE